MASSGSDRGRDLQDVFRHLNVEERKKLLARVLQFPEFNEEDDLKTAILIDVYYEMLSYLVNNGFPWQEIASFFEIFKILLNKTQGKSLVEAISLFKEQLFNNAQHFNDNNLKCAIDYSYLTFFQHYKLYQFVLTQDRASHTTKLHCVVEPPGTVLLAMKEGVTKSVWDEQQRLKEIDQMEQKRNEEREAYFQDEMQHAVQQLEQQLYEFESLPEQVTREQLSAIISSVTANKAAVTSASINHKLHEMHDSLEFKYKRTNTVNDTKKEGKKSATPSRHSGKK